MTSKLPDINATYCCVPSCDSDTFKNIDSSITLHKFPQDPKLSVKWIQEINSAYKKSGDKGPQWFPKANSVVCSKHFQATDFTNDLLKPKAVPTIFINRTDQPTAAAPAATIDKMKPNDIKSILSRASDLFNKNMAIAKSLEGTIPAPCDFTKENKCSVATPTVSSDLPELNLDMSLAALQSKLSTPAKTQNDLQKDNESTPTTSTPVVKSQVTKASIQVSGKRKLEDDPPFEFVKIGENKYLKIQRVPGNASSAITSLNYSPGPSSSFANKSATSNLKPGETSSLVAMLTENCSADEKQNVIQALNKYNVSQNGKTNLDSSSTTAVSKTIASCSDGKVGDDSLSDFIKIGNGKYLKISRVPANKPLHSSTPIKKTTISIPKSSKKTTNTQSNGSKKSVNVLAKGNVKPTNVHPESTVISVYSDAEDDIVLSSDSDNSCNGSKDQDPSKLSKTNEILNAKVTESISSISSDIDKIIDTVATSASETVSSNQPESSETTMSINKSPEKSLSPKKKPSIKKEQTSSKKVGSKIKKSTIKTERSFFKFGKMPMFKLTLEEENGLLKTKIAELEKRTLMPLNQQTALERENILLKKELEKFKKDHSQLKEGNIYKKLKSILEESSKGDASATYILDQINAFGSKIHKYSNSTYLHCALLCRKNAQAYELFRKAELFKLPTFNTVDRYMRKHPDVSLSGKSNPGDSKHGIIKLNSSPNQNKPNILKSPPKRAPVQVLTNSPRGQIHFPRQSDQHEMSTVEVDTSNSELREVVLETGEVVQCYSSDICIGEDGHQYFIMRDDQSNALSQDEYVPNSSGQLQYTETEVAIATGMIS